MWSRRILAMAVQTTRTDAAAATLRLYDRLLHPELFAGLKSVVQTFPGGSFRTDITEAGHILILQYGSLQLLEVVGTYDNDSNPDYGRVASTAAKSGRCVDWSNDTIRYWAACHLDVVDSEVFERLDREITLDSRSADLFARLGSGNRLDPSPVSMVRVEPLDRAISIHTAHTYPSELTILRSQTLIEFV